MASFDTGLNPAQRETMVETRGPRPDSNDDRASMTLGTNPETAAGIVPGTLSATGASSAFTLTLRRPSAIPVLIAVPHAGRIYPDDLTAMMRNPDHACSRLEDRLVDLVADAVAHETGAALLVAHAPRAMIDLNRAPDDIDWDMVEGDPGARPVRHAIGRRARSGLGLVPRRLPGFGELWKRRVTSAELAARLAQVHQPYHAALAGAFQGLRDHWGAALLIDLHSMPPLGGKRGSDPAPDFVVGDRFGAACEPALSLTAIDHFDRHRRRVAHNRPYAGGYVLDRHALPARGLHGMQIEVCRSAYLDGALRQPGPGLEATVRVLSSLVRRLAEELAGPRAGEREWRQAAE